MATVGNVTPHFSRGVTQKCRRCEEISGSTAKCVVHSLVRSVFSTSPNYDIGFVHILSYIEQVKSNFETLCGLHDYQSSKCPTTLSRKLYGLRFAKLKSPFFGKNCKTFFTVEETYQWSSTDNVSKTEHKVHIFGDAFDPE